MLSIGSSNANFELSSVDAAIRIGETLTNTNESISTKRVNFKIRVKVRNVLIIPAEVSPRLGTSIVANGQKQGTIGIMVGMSMVAINRISLLDTKGVPKKIAAISQGVHVGSTNMSNERGVESALNSTRVESSVLRSGVSKQHVHVNSSTGADSWNHKVALHKRGNKEKQRKQKHQARNR